MTARDSEFDRVLGLQAGSDDYIVKPYGFRELLARIEAVMRRVRAQPVPAQTIEHGPLLIDPAARRATLAGAPLDLTRKEFDLLLLLASKMHSVVSSTADHGPGLGGHLASARPDRRHPRQHAAQQTRLAQLDRHRPRRGLPARARLGRAGISANGLQGNSEPPHPVTRK